jgi:outer membrane protein
MRTRIPIALRFAMTALVAAAVVLPSQPLAQGSRPTELAGPGQIEEALQEVLDEALAANLELQAGGATVQQRMAALDRARARYLPVLDFVARYSVADGGRAIDLPLGDLLNPVYSTLDALLIESGRPPQFPRVENQRFEFLRPQEQETKFVLEQPIYAPRIGPAVEANRQELARVEADLAALRTRVTRDTKQAYYRWIAAQQTVAVLNATRELAQTNLRSNESLYRNGKVTRDLVFRAEADLLEIEQQRIAAQSGVRIAQSYVNLLRNRPLSDALPGATIDEQTVLRFRNRFIERLAGRPLDLALLQDLATERRAELRGLDAAVAAGEAQQDLARAAFKPTFALGAEAGIQGEDYGFGEDERYVLAAVILRWNTFRGGADRAALREARALTEELRATRELATQQVRLDVQQALENLQVADASLDTAVKRSEAAEGSFRIASRKRDLGQINQAEFIDARRALTDAQLNLTRVRAEFLGRLAELEFAVGSSRAAEQELLQ